MLIGAPTKVLSVRGLSQVDPLSLFTLSWLKTTEKKMITPYTESCCQRTGSFNQLNVTIYSDELLVHMIVLVNTSWIKLWIFYNSFVSKHGNKFP